MTVKELIAQLLNEDMDAEITIEAASKYYSGMVSVQGIRDASVKVVIVPETYLQASDETPV